MNAINKWQFNNSLNRKFSPLRKHGGKDKKSPDSKQKQEKLVLIKLAED